VTRSPAAFLVAFFLLVAAHAAGAGATGLYLDLPHWFAPVDSSALAIDAGQTFLDRPTGRAALARLGFTARRWRRGVVRASLFYPAMRTEAGVVQGGGDGLVRAEWRAWGDTLDTRGLFLRGELRVPMGSSAFYPFSLGSLDGGAGVEARLPAGMLRLRAGAVYTLVGERRKSGDRPHRNHLVAAAGLGFDPGERTACDLTAFLISFRGGERREVYLLGVHRLVGDRFGLGLSVAVDSGDERERVFDTLGGVFFEYRFGGVRRSRPDPESKRDREPETRPAIRRGDGK